MAGITLTLTCRSFRELTVLSDLQSWVRNTRDPVLADAVRCAWIAPSAERAVSFIRENPGEHLLLALGCRRREAEPLCEELPGTDVVACPPRGWPDRTSPPTATLLYPPALTVTCDPLTAVRKAILRVRARDYVSIRPLDPEADSSACSSQRGTWREERLHPKPHPTGLRVGAFRRDGELIARAHLACVARQWSGCSRRNEPEHPFEALGGLAALRWNHRLLAACRRTAEVTDVRVEPEYRGNGLGETLVDSVVSLARAEGVRTLFLTCCEDQRGFYERCGFRVAAAQGGADRRTLLMEQHLAPLDRRLEDRSRDPDLRGILVR